MAEREHFTNGRCFAGGMGFTMIATAFGAHIAGWHHWITIGVGYGSGIILSLFATILITRSYYLRHETHTQSQQPLQPRGSSNDILDGVFSSTQITAFRVAKELRDFLVDTDPRPNPPRKNDIESSEELANEITARWELIGPWLLKLQHRYAREMAPKVKEAMHLLGEEGVAVTPLEPFCERVNNEQDVYSAAQALDYLSTSMSYQPFVLSTQAKETLRMVDNMSSNAYKEALSVPGFGEAVDEAIANRDRGQL